MVRKVELTLKAPSAEAGAVLQVVDVAHSHGPSEAGSTARSLNHAPDIKWIRLKKKSITPFPALNSPTHYTNNMHFGMSHELCTK